MIYNHSNEMVEDGNAPVKESTAAVSNVAAMRRRLTTKSLLAICYLLLITAAVYNTALLPGRTILPADLLLLTSPWKHHSQELMPGFDHVARPAWDPLFQFYPARKFLGESLRAGTVPLWNPWFYCGTPFAADGQSAVYYPPNWLFAVLPLASTFGWIAALHTFLAGLFFTLYGRRTGWGWSASLTGATAWMLCGVMVVWQMWQVIDAALCWLPLALYFWEGWRRRGRPRDLAGMAVALGMSALAGHLQFTFYVYMTVLAYGLLRSFSGPRLDTVPPAKSIAALIGAFALGIGIASVQLLSTVDYLHHTNRVQLPLAALTATSMPPSQLLMLVAPDIFGGQRDFQLPYIGLHGQADYYELTCFCGAAVLAFAMFGVRWAKSPDDARPRTLFWLGLAVFALLMGCGSPLYALFYYGVPLFKSFHGPGRVLVLFDFSVAVLAAEGIQRLLTSDAEERRKYAGRIVGGLAVAVLLGLRFAVTNTSPVVAFTLTHSDADVIAGVLHGRLMSTMAQLGIVAATLILAWLVLAFVPKRFAWAGVTVVAAQCLWFAVGVNSSVPSTLLYPPTTDTEFVSKNLGDGRVWCIGDGSNSGQSKLIPNSAMSLGWRDVAGSDPLVLAKYGPVADELDQDQPKMPPAGTPGSVAIARPLLNRLNVKYVISPRPLADNDLTQAYAGDIYVYQNPSAFGLAALSTPSNSTLPVNVTGYSPDLIKLVNQSGQVGLLTTSVVYDSAWKATVDGRPTVPVSDSIYLAVPVTAGAHDVVFSYRPGATIAGLYLTCLAWLLTITLVTVRLHSSQMR